MDESDVLMLQDIEHRVHTTLNSIIEDYEDSEEDCALAIPAVLLKLTLQIYKEIMTDEDDVSNIIMHCLNDMKDLPPLQRQKTIH